MIELYTITGKSNMQGMIVVYGNNQFQYNWTV